MIVKKNAVVVNPLRYSMRIASWNVNSIRVRIQQVLNFIDCYSIDILLLQEIKCTTEMFPYKMFENKGFNCAIYGQKAYNGVAIVSRYQIEDINLGSSIFKNNDARYIDAIINGFRIACVYIPNGQEVGIPYYFYKLEFFDTLTEYLSTIISSQRVILGGDFNVTRSDTDVWNPQLWYGKNCCSDAERKKFQTLLDIGFCDVPREHVCNRELFTWWDYRNQSFRLNHGLRLDYILTDQRINVINWQRCIKMRQVKQPSDHIPIIVDI